MKIMKRVLKGPYPTKEIVLEKDSFILRLSDGQEFDLEEERGMLVIRGVMHSECDLTASLCIVPNVSNVIGIKILGRDG